MERPNGSKPFPSWYLLSGSLQSETAYLWSEIRIPSYGSAVLDGRERNPIHQGAELPYSIQPGYHARGPLFPRICPEILAETAA